VIKKKHNVRIAGKIWLSGGRELDLKVVCRRGVKNYLSDCHRDVPRFKKNPVNPTLTKRGSACIYNTQSVVVLWLNQMVLTIYSKKRCTKNRVMVIAGGVDFFFYYLSDRVGICGCESREEISPNRAPFNISLSGKPLTMQSR
jgi:hypothetical protein